MSETARVLVSLLGPILVLVPGLGLLAFAPSLERRLGRGGRLGLAYLLGAAWIGIGVLALSLFGGAPLRRGTVVPILVAPALAGGLAALRRRARATGLESTVPIRARTFGVVALLSAVAASAVAVVFGALLAEASTNPVRDWDGRMTWMPLARWMRAERTVRPAVLTDARWWVTHPQYPPLVPATVVALQETLNLPEDDRCVRPFYAAFWLALAGIVHGGARRLAGRVAASIAVLLFVSLPFVAFESHGGAAGVYSDLPLAAFFGGGLTLLVLSRRRIPDGLLGGLLLAAAVLTKNEGAPLAAAALAAVLVAGPGRTAGRRRFAGPLAAALPIVLAVLVLAAYRAPIPNRFDEDYGLLLKSRFSVSLALAQLRAAFPAALAETIRPASWGLFFPAVALLLVAGRRCFRHPAGPALALASLAPVAVGLSAYSVSFDVPGIVQVTWARLLLHGLAPLLLLSALALRPVVGSLEPRTGRSGGPGA